MPPGLQDLGLERLAQDGEWKALAAVVHHAAPDSSERRQALKLLAQDATDEEGFRWLWVTMRADRQTRPRDAAERQYWAVLREGLTARDTPLAVPDALVEEVSQFILAAPLGGNPPHPRDGAQGALLAALPPRQSLGRDIAREVDPGETGRHSEEVILAALQLLAGSKAGPDRDVAIARAEHLVYPQRLQIVARLPTGSRRRVKDINAIVNAVTSVPVNSMPNETHEPAGKLIATLPPERIMALFTGRWGSAAADKVDPMRLARELPEEVLQDLVSSDDVPEQVRAALITSATQLPVERCTAFATWLQAQDPEAARPLFDGAAQRARRELQRNAQKVWVNTVHEVALATVDPHAASVYGAMLAPDEAVELVSTAEDTPARQLGAIVSPSLVSGGDDAAAAAVAILEAAPQPTDEFVTGLLEPLDTDTDEHRQLAAAVVAYRGDDRDALRAAVAGGFAPTVVDTAEQAGGEVCLAVLEAAHDLLDDGAIDALWKAISWTTLAPDSYRRYLTLLDRERSDLLAEEAGAALGSLGGPASTAITDDLLAELLKAALDHELGGDIEDDQGEALSRVLHHPSPDLRRLACRWAAQLWPSRDVVETVRAAHESSAGLDDAFTDTRRGHAEQLVAAARDDDAPWDERVQALEVAERADREVAKAAALDLLTVTHRDLRLQAARTVRQVGLTHDDIPRVHQLLDGEADREVADALETALRRVESGDIGEAIRNLYELVGLDPNQAPGADVLLPVPEQHEQFIASVDHARSDSHGTVSSYATSLAVLADSLVEFALVARQDAGQRVLRPAEVEGIRANTAKPDVGDLVHRQQLLPELPWFHAVATLRDLRRGHAAPRGTVRPTSYDDDQRPLIEGLMGQIVEGWESSMRETASLRAARS